MVAYRVQIHAVQISKQNATLSTAADIAIHISTTHKLSTLVQAVGCNDMLFLSFERIPVLDPSRKRGLPSVPNVYVLARSYFTKI